jgi:polyisoprenoid-binding protein YceI
MNAIVGKWVIDPSNSNVTFSVRHLVSKVTGSFGEFKGEADVLEDISNSTVYGVADVTTITTDDEDRDARLRSPEFFDVGNHPTITFKTNRWNESEASDEITLEGELTIRDVTQPVTFVGEFGSVQVDEVTGQTRADLKLTAEINRTDWGLSWNSSLDKGGLVLGEEVTIVVDAQAVRTDPEPDEVVVPDEPETPVFV